MSTKETSADKTKYRLAEAAKKCMASSGTDAMTVTQIVQTCGVTRQTFYRNFQDKYDLLEWIIDKELLEPVEPLIQNGMINEALVLLFSGIEREKEFYTKASRLEGQNSFGSIAQSCVERVLLQVIKGQAEGRKSRYVWLTPERIAEYYAQSMCYVVITWIKSGMTISSLSLIHISEPTRPY